MRLIKELVEIMFIRHGYVMSYVSVVSTWVVLLFNIFVNRAMLFHIVVPNHRKRFPLCVNTKRVLKLNRSENLILLTGLENSSRYVRYVFDDVENFSHDIACSFSSSSKSLNTSSLIDIHHVEFVFKISCERTSSD